MIFIDIILNEKEFAEEVIRSGEVSKHPSSTVSLLVRYYYHELGYRKTKIVAAIDSFMKKNYEYYVDSEWYDTIIRYINKAKKQPLVYIPFVPITKSELDTIQTLGNIKQEKFLFACLCLAKYNDLVRDTNNGWVNFDDNQIFKSVRINDSLPRKEKILITLIDNHYLDTTLRVDSNNLRVNFIDNESEIILKITDFRELGYEYLLYKGENYVRCQKCGILVEQSKTKPRFYCDACSTYKPVLFKTIHCADCGCEVTISALDNKTYRCPYHQKEAKKAKDRLRKREKKSNST